MKRLGGSSTHDGLILEEHISPPGEFPDVQFLTHMIAVGKMFVPCRIFWKESGAEKTCLLLPGGALITTATPQIGFRWEGHLDMSVLSIGMSMMERALPEPFAQRPVELRTTRTGERDLVLEHLVGALGEIFKRHSPREKLAIESLCNSTAVYLAQRYGVFPQPLDIYRSGLAQDRLSRVLDYIEGYLERDLSVMELADVACLSPYHFGKMFKRSMKQSVHQYVIARRVERAKSLLVSPKLPLAEIALVVGFQDQSQFTAVFKRSMGITPGVYARAACGLKRAVEA
jgi:AraC family transcriptional regulator